MGPVECTEGGGGAGPAVLAAVAHGRDEGGGGKVAAVHAQGGVLERVRPFPLIVFAAKFATDINANRVYIENHDQARSVSRFGNDSPAWRARSAKMLALFQTTQTGTLFVFQGEELGLKNFPRSWGIEEYKDVATINYYKL